jgi:O-antigen biosynthesis protein WbqV
MIRLAGLRPDKDIELQFLGTRPGEKLHEELFHDEEPLIDTGHAGLHLAAARTSDLDVLVRAIDELEAAARACQIPHVLDLLRRHVPDYRVSDTPAGGATVHRLHPNAAAR